MLFTGPVSLPFGLGGLHSLFSAELVAHIAIEKFKAVQLNSNYTLIIWHAPVCEVRDDVNNDEFCVVVDMSSVDAGRDAGEGFALIRSDRVGYEIRRGDIYTPNSIRFFHK